jgi:hypothetical protein
MYGEIPGPEVEAKSPLIEEGAIYIISRFRVSNAKFGYRPVDARFMVEFTLHTTISAARNNMPDFPAYAYKITPINELSSHAGDTRNFLGWFTSFQNPFLLFLFLYLIKECSQIQLEYWWRSLMLTWFTFPTSLRLR